MFIVCIINNAFHLFQWSFSSLGVLCFHPIFSKVASTCVNFLPFFKKQITRLAEFNNAPVTIMRRLFVIA